MIMEILFFMVSYSIEERISPSINEVIVHIITEQLNTCHTDSIVVRG